MGHAFRLCFPALLFLSVMVGASVTSHSAAAWEQIGARTVEGLDRDIVPVRAVEGHRSVRVCATRAPVNLLHLRLVFGNGADQEVAVRRVLRPGSCTRAIDLVGGRRILQRVVLVYAPNTARRPIVSVAAR